MQDSNLRKLSLSSNQTSSWPVTIRVKLGCTPKSRRQPRLIRNMSFLASKPEGVVRILEMPDTRRGQSRPFMDWRIFGEQDQWAGL